MARKALRITSIEVERSGHVVLTDDKGRTWLEPRHMESKGMHDIAACAICGKPLPFPREHVDTCGKRCFSKQLEQQRQDFGDAELEDFTCKCGAEFHLPDWIGEWVQCACGIMWRREPDGNLHEIKNGGN